MCISNIVLYPDEILRTSSKVVTDFSSTKVIETIEKLQATMDSYSHCVGLAANQIGSDLNIFIADASKNKNSESKYGNVVVINARIVSRKGSETNREGCMSVPDLTGNVSRATQIEVIAFDETGNEVAYEIADFEARVFQHEIDHLAGKVFLDRVTSARDVFTRKKYRT